MEKLVQVLKVGEVRKGIAKKSGNPYTMQELDAVLIDQATGAVEGVCVVRLPRDLVGTVEGPGMFKAGFELVPHYQSRELVAELKTLEPYAKPAAAVSPDIAGPAVVKPARAA